MSRLSRSGNARRSERDIICVRCVNFLRARLFCAHVPLANSYLVRMNNRSRYRDEAFEVFIIESETWRERRREREREKEEESILAQRVRIFNQWRY